MKTSDFGICTVSEFNFESPILGGAYLHTSFEINCLLKILFKLCILRNLFSVLFRYGTSVSYKVSKFPSYLFPLYGLKIKVQLCYIP